MNKERQQRSLKGRALVGAFWIVGSSGAFMVVRLISNLFMTRFLLPDAFGMISLAMILVSAIELISDIGIRQSIIREPDGETSRFLRVAWTTQLFRSGIVAIGVLSMAIVVHIFGEDLSSSDSAFGQPEMPNLVALLSVHALLNGAVSTVWVREERRLNFGRITIIELVAQLLTFAMMVLLVQLYATVWTLLAGMLFGGFVKMALSHIALPGPRMGLCFDRDTSVRIWRFGKWLLASSSLHFLTLQADRLFLGAILNAATYGIYSIANTWIEVALGAVQRLSGQVGYTAFAEVKNQRPEALAAVFEKYMRYTTLIAVVSSMGCLVFARPFVAILYTPTYQEIAYYLQLMAPSLLFNRFVVHHELLIATGNSRAMAVGSLIRAIAICIFVPLGFFIHGVEGAIVSAIFARSTAIPYILFANRPVLHRTHMLLECLWFLFGVGMLIAIPMLN